MPSQKQRQGQAPGQIPKQKGEQKSKQSLAQKIAHSTALRQTPREFLKSVEADGIVEAAMPDYQSVSAAPEAFEGVQDQRSWNEEDSRSRGTNTGDATSTETLDFIYESLSTSETLPDYLRKELAAFLSADERKAFDAILSELDQQTGFLKAAAQEIAEESGLGEREISSVLEKMRNLEPAGIGTRGKIEYQLHLLERAGQKQTAEFKILSAYLANPKTHHSDLIEIVEEEELSPALERIQRLPTYPWKGTPNRTHGQQIALLDLPEHAQPEIRFVKEEGQWIAKVERDYVARASLAPAYEQMIHKLKQNAEDDAPNRGKRKRAETRHSDTLLSDLSLLEKVVRARPKSRDNNQLIERVEVTKQKLLAWKSGVVSYVRLADFVGTAQTSFFESDCDWTQLQPLSRNQVAEAIHVHPGRVWSHLRNCWITIESVSGRAHPPLPLLALIASSHGDTGAPPADFEKSAEKEKDARTLISRIIDTENPKHRVTDDILRLILTACGYPVTRQWIASRRTRLGFAEVQYAGEPSERAGLGARTQPKEREWIPSEAEALLKRAEIRCDRARLAAAFRDGKTTGGTAYNPFAANMVLRNILRHEPASRPLSAAHLSVLLRTLGFPLSRQWVKLALTAKPDGRKKSEESFQWRPVGRADGRAATWSSQELGLLLGRIGYAFDPDALRDAYERVIEQERNLSREKMRTKRQGARAGAVRIPIKT